MNIAQYSMERKTTSWMLFLILLIGGLVALTQLGRLEDPKFTIKQAMVITPYPGASAQQVEEEVTYKLENAIQELSYVDHVKSISKPGLSQITVEMKSIYREEHLHQIWDELRRKINDTKGQLPPGTSEPIIRDDFADVYGVMMAITGPDYSYKDIEHYADFLRRELVLVDGVGKVTLAGEQQEQVVVEVSRSRLANFGVPPSRIAGLLQTQNAVANAGRVTVDQEALRIATSGEFANVEDMAKLVISNPGAEQRIYLRDVATIYRETKDIPDHVVRYNGKASLWLALSFADNVNVVEVGERLQKRMDELEYAKPIGMSVDRIYDQPHQVENSVNDFLLNLVEAVAIVIIALLLTMGFRSGLLIGTVLLLTVLGTFIFMRLGDINLQRVSLGALIIALGMLVDNAIVIADGIMVGMRRGMSKVDAAVSVVKQNQWPLLGATVIGIIAFAPIGLSSDATGEFAGSLFWVLLISLLLSWVTALTLIPFLADRLYSAKDIGNSDEQDDVFSHPVYRGYKKMLAVCLRHRIISMLVMLVTLVAAVVGFGQAKQAFFPPSTTPLFYVDLWYPQGTDIRHTEQDSKRLEDYLLEKSDVTSVATTIGQGAPRFTLTYLVEKSYESYAQLLVRVEGKDAMDALMRDIRERIREEHPDVEDKLIRVEIGPATPAKIEARFSGPDIGTLRELSKKAQAILAEDSGAVNIRSDWRTPTKLLRPEYDEAAGRRAGITKEDVNNLLLANFVGRQIGIYRDGTDLLPIVQRAPAAERVDLDNWQELQIYSPAFDRFVPLAQVARSIDVVWEDPLILRRDRKRTLTVMADHDLLGEETAAQVFERVRPKLEGIDLPLGYELTWGGEHEAAGKAEKALFGALPLGFLVMFIITVLLFNSIRQAAVLWTTVPLSIIGVTVGLLLLDKPFGFMALLGFLSLSGMLIKNGVVLLEQVNAELDAGKEATQALSDAAVSRVRPVGMAAATTILGMIPLLFDDFFASMATVIMFGLGFATLLTLFVVPVMYAIVQRVPRP
ncbi:multidrug efflux pump subunit AcrB [Idiomarina loihiensis]|mgnify:CR=1 FL=1|uniref:efflux RND transporter permease subunit n=1 Tax=Idiomarina TaxID=135575 RepID=UPI000D718B83|nr:MULTISPECIES: efflux RND transporter permease subunit [Idiomarina]PWW37614.1 multidrug efflux pump subunit AcrB [Idiomarina loihiensis]TDP47479.1 multidrug efflux pump subunit AcrB [Idiomarina loihiensis]TDS23220.1 multidrug efflux pump subunit AcrB [Idiomarina sp. H2]|tara:strand:+ start:2215 stop:5268 length:3054 start_codon:yes stop_codon:yes gene_type:complete